MSIHTTRTVSVLLLIFGDITANLRHLITFWCLSIQTRTVTDIRWHYLLLISAINNILLYTPVPRYVVYNTTTPHPRPLTTDRVSALLLIFGETSNLLHPMTFHSIVHTSTNHLRCCSLFNIRCTADLLYAMVVSCPNQHCYCSVVIIPWHHKSTARP